MKTKLHLQDHGQDFTWLIVDGSEIVDAGPFQGWLWRGERIRPPVKWKRGSRVVMADGSFLHYPVQRVEQIKQAA